MTRDQALELLRARVAALVDGEGLRPFANRVGVPLGRVRSVLDQRDTSISTIIAIADAIGYEVYVGPVRSRHSVRPDHSPDVDYGSANPHPGATGPAVETVSDRRLAALIAALADDWEAADEYRRGEISGHLRTLRLRGGRRLRAL